MSKHICEVVYKFHYRSIRGKDETSMKRFISEEGDWPKCHDEAYEYARNLRKEGNVVHRLELLHTASTTIKS